MLLHKNLAAFCCWLNKELYDLKSNDRVATYANFGFYANMMDLCPTITSVASLYIIQEDMQLDVLK